MPHLPARRTRTRPCSLPGRGGTGPRATNHGAMLRSARGIGERDLERRLLRRGLGELAAGRHACGGCGRTPLVGEELHTYPQDVVVCTLCRASRTDMPERSERVQHPAGGSTVRLRARLVA